MASIRSPSPADDASPPSSPQLTPRSKIKALLATLDDSSDGEDSGPIDVKALFKKVDESATSNGKPASTHSEHESEDTDDEDEEEDFVRPRGRLAARLMGNEASKKLQGSKSPENVQKRVGKPNAPKTTEEDAAASIDKEDEQEDEEFSVAPRRWRLQPARSTTPEATMNRDISVSPGLFVSPSPQKAAKSLRPAADSDSDLPADLSKSARFQALVARKRKERLAREAEEERKRMERAKRNAHEVPTDSDDNDDVSDVSDDDGGRKLTQDNSRPARKASKKALEEMNREMQRISRQLQLTHEAKTKKKITKASLFERFNFKPQEARDVTGAVNDLKLNSSSRPTTPASAPQTDVEMVGAGTPPSSPPSIAKKAANAAASASQVEGQVNLEYELEEDENGELPNPKNALEQSKKLSKGKGKATPADVAKWETEKSAATKPKRQVRVRISPVQANTVTIESDDELEVTAAKKQTKIDALFNKLPAKKAQEPRSMHALRQLAHLSSPPQDARKKKQKTYMTVGELQLSLVQRARAQANEERERRLEALKAKGVVVQSAEEREREREQVEDIVARARKEAEEIMAREREDAKKARKEKKKNGDNDALDWDDSEDDSYDEEGAETKEIELSGSEDEGEDGKSDNEPAGNTMFDENADEGANEEIESEGEELSQATDFMVSDEEEEDIPSTKTRAGRTKKNGQILSDDEDEEAVEATPKPKKTYAKSPAAPRTVSPQAPTSVLRSATKTFIPGLPVPAAGAAGLGLTQIFAGTMDDNSQQDAPSSGSPLAFMPSFGNFPDSQFSATAGASQSASDMILDSQNETQKTAARETQNEGVQLRFDQSQMHGFDSLMQMDSTQMSEMLEPTQDGGYVEFSPLKQRFVEPPQDTVEAVVLPQQATQAMDSVLESPLVRKKGKLRRRNETMVSETPQSLPPTDIPRSPSPEASPAPVRGSKEHIQSNTVAEEGVSAFKAMQKAAKRQKRAQEKFDKKKSTANDMVEVQAEESEDEYAGLGGADGEDSSEDDEELHKEMIDDDADNDVDERKLAAFFADRERAADSAQVDKLFHDITTGMLRKRRRGGGGGGNDFDLSDSDDDGEARRRMKRRQFAKMQKALFADERIGKISENPRNAAFLKSIEDRDSDDEWDFADNFAEEKISQSQDSQSQETGQNDAIPDSQPTAGAEDNVGRKRTRQDPESGAPSSKSRRPKKGARPASIVDIKRSLSSLLDEPNTVIPNTQIGSDSEDDEQQPSSSDKENHRRLGLSVAVVDRNSLKRAGSSNTSSGSGSKLAFAPSANASAGVFKVPALLRRATTNSSLIANTSTSAAGPKAGGFGDEAKLKKNAGKKSGVNFFARENERREKIQETEKRRQAKKMKGFERRKKAVGGLFGSGSFE